MKHVSTEEQRTKGKRRARGVLGFVMAVAMLCFLAPAGAFAAPSLNWTSPPDGSVYSVGTLVAPTGTAAGFATGAGLDLALVLDASGSMASTSAGKTRRQWQADAANALVNSLPTTNTAVAVAQFTSSGSLSLPLTATTSAADIVAAINAVPASGGTSIHAGINVATSELTGANATAGRAKQMVVISDGGSTLSSAVAAATAANDAGITVHGVVIPGGNTATMQAVATAGGGSFSNFTNLDDLANIEAFFGAGGGFVGLDQLDITLPDGTLMADYPTDAFGNFVINPDWAIVAGNNTFMAHATFVDGSSLSAPLNLIGTTGTAAPDTPVPAPAAAGLFGFGLGLMGLVRSRRREA